MIIFHCDFQIIVGQVNGDYEAKEDQMKKYLCLGKQLVGQHLEAKFIKVLIEKNVDADIKAKFIQSLRETLGTLC